MASTREGHTAVLPESLWGPLPNQAVPSSCREAWATKGECLAPIPVCGLKLVVALAHYIMLLLQRLELDPAELAGRLVLTLEQAQAALRDLPDGLKESFW